jgi:hypothetical protein
MTRGMAKEKFMRQYVRQTWKIGKRVHENGYIRLQNHESRNAKSLLKAMDVHRTESWTS